MLKTLAVIPLWIISAQVGAQAASTPGMIGHQMGDSTERREIKTPRVPFKYAVGMNKFRTLCSSCHGKWAEGSEQGPPLLHNFYVPSHHSDSAFYSAALEGVRAHHWKYGDMPKVEGATTKDVEKIVPFVRWLQQANGIY